jgi:hypothetical protein
MLADSSGDILDDEELINNLAASKTTSEAIGGRMRDAETTSKEINETRELYRPVVSVLRFCDECPSGCCARCFFVGGRPCRRGWGSVALVLFVCLKASSCCLGMCACCVQATRGSVLYFVIADMAMVDSMYQYSLPAFTRLYNLRMDRSKKSEVTCVMRPRPLTGRTGAGAVVGDDCRPSVLRASVWKGQ